MFRNLHILPKWIAIVGAKGLIYIFLLLCTWQFVRAQNSFGNTTWEEGLSVLSRPDGGFWLTGRARIHPDSSLDVLLVNLDDCGLEKNRFYFGGNQQDAALWIEGTSDGGFVLAGYAYEKTGGFGRHDLYILKFNAAGNLEWEKLLGRPYREMAFCIRELADGYALFGYTKSVGKIGDFNLLKLDFQGNQIWEEHYPKLHTDFGHHLLLQDQGTFLMLGTSSGWYFPSQANHHSEQSDIMLIQADEQGQELQRKTYGGLRHEFGRSMVPDPNGGYFIFGSSQSQGAGSFDFFLLKVNEDLDSVWAQTYGGPGFDYGTGIVRAADGLYLGGTSSAGVGLSPDAKVIKVDFDGNPVWEIEIGGADSEYGESLRPTADGGCVLAGYRILSDQNRDLLIAKVNSDGTIGFLLDPLGEAKVVPNPVIGESGIWPGENLNCTALKCKVYNSTGKLVMERESDGSYKIGVSASELSFGTYFYELWQGNERKARGKFVVH